MSHRVRIAFAICSPGLSIVERVAPRFAALADVSTCATHTDGSNFDAVVPALAETAPDAVVALPKPAARLRERLSMPVIPFESPADVLFARVEEALREADSVAVLPPAGTISPAAIRLLRRLGGEVHVLPYENPGHLRDLEVRCRRIGVRTLLGGESILPLAAEEGLTGVSLNDRQDEPAGVMAQLIVKAAAQVAQRPAGRPEEPAAFGVILEKIAQGAIGPHDTALCVDPRGRVTAAFTPPAVNGAGRAPAPALPAGSIRSTRPEDPGPGPLVARGEDARYRPATA